MSSVPTVLTADNMRKVVEEEGLEARNLLNWNVIVSEKSTLEVPKTSKKPPTSPRPQSASPKPPPKEAESHFQPTKRCPSLGRPKSRVRSSSAGRNPEKGLRARYWAFLFENLYRAVDEIYQTCEMDESIVESKEAIMMLENYCKEFQALIQWLNISKNYEITSPPNRPTSLAWEVRKSLPSKGMLKNVFFDKLVSQSGAKRKLVLQSSEFVQQSIGVQTDASSEGSPTAGVECSVPVVMPCGDEQPVCEKPLVPLSTSMVPNEQQEVVPDEEIKISQTAVNGNSDCKDVCSDGAEASASSGTDGSEKQCQQVNTGESANILSTDEHSSCTEICTSVINNSECAYGNGEVACSSVIDEPVKDLSCSDAKCGDSDSTLVTATEGSKVAVQASESCSEVNNDILPHLSNSRTTDVIYFTEDADVLNLIYSSSENNVTKIANSDSDKTAENDVNACSSDANASSMHDTLPNDSQVSMDVDTSTTEKDDSIKNHVESAAVSTMLPKEVAEPGTKCSQSSQTEIVMVKKDAGQVASKTDVATNAPKSKPQTVTGFASAAARVAKGVTNSITAGPSSGTTKTYASRTSLSKLSGTPALSTSRPVANDRLAKPINKNRPFTERSVPERKPLQKKTLGVAAEKQRFRASTAAVRNSERYLQGTTTTNVTASAPIQRSRPSQHHLGKELRMQAKSGSSLSLNLNTSSSGSIDQIKRQNSDLCRKPSANQDNGEDSDGWETVRGRTRCKNSPAKKVLPSSEAYDQAVVAKLCQSKMGGFPYTCTSNKQPTKQPAKAVSTKTSASSEVKNIPPVIKANKQDPHVPKVKPVIKVSSACSSSKNDASKKLSKEDPKPEPRKTAPQKQDLKASPKSKPTGQANANEVRKNTFSPRSIDKKPLNSTGSSAVLLGKQRLPPSKVLKSSSESKIVLKKAYSSGSVTKSKTLAGKEALSAESLQVSNSESNELSKSPIGESSTLSPESKPSRLVSKVPSENDVLSIESLTSKSAEDAPLLTDQKLLDDNTSNVPCAVTPDARDCSKLDSKDEVNLCDEGLSEEQSLDVYESMMKKETQEHIRQLGLSWGDQMDLLDMDWRTPGRALQIHEKLSSPFRKRTLAETIRLQEEKQLKAQEQREKFLEEKAQRFKDIQKKVEEMKALTEKKAEQQRMILEQKLQRAEEKRKKELEKIIRKAHDEEEKVNEIAFINSLEAQNKRHDLISKEKDHEARLQDIQGERQRKLEEKAAKEAAAEERRKVLEAERQARLFEMQEKRKQRDLKIEQQLLEKEKERQELANQKARDRELRLSALNAAQQANAEELQKKIQLKQEESARRHEENIEQIRQKAFELTVRRYSSNNDDAPQLVPYEKKKICTICNVLIGSEVYLLSHLRGKKHQEMISDRHQGHDPSTEELEQYNLKHIVDASVDQISPTISIDKERQKALKKRCKKLRQRLASKGLEFKKSFETNHKRNAVNEKSKMRQYANDIKKYLSYDAADFLDNAKMSSLEKFLIEMDKYSEYCCSQDKIDFFSLGGTDAIMDLVIKITPLLTNNNSMVSNRVVKLVCNIAESLTKNCFESCVYVLMSNKIGMALDVLVSRLRALIPDNFKQMMATTNSVSSGKSLPVDENASQLMCLLTIVLDFLAKRRVGDESLMAVVQKFLPGNNDDFVHRINDIISYIVSIGVVDRLSQYFNIIRGTVNALPDVATFLLHSMSFLMSIVKLSSDSYEGVFERKKTEDSNQLMAALKVTDMVGAVSLLYCILLHDGSPSFGNVPPTPLPEHTLLLTLASLRMLNHSAVMNLHVVQGILGSEGISLQLRHIANYLLWYCSHWSSSDLLHEVILLIGYFTVLNSDNQVVIQSGQQPTVLKQLSNLPFHYFSNKDLTDILFPTLISCSFNNDHNKQVLAQEMSIELLCNYLERYLLDTYCATQAKNDPNIRWRLLSRFPKCRWTFAKAYFAKPL